jgi:hypothetical protein
MKRGKPRTRCQKVWRGLLLVVLIYVTDQMLPPYPELVVEIGGTYEDMIERSSAEFDPFIPATSWFGEIESPARLRFVDPEYGFTAPASRTLYVSFDDNIVTHLSARPQTRPLTLDEALEVILGLQEQWRAAGWYEFDPRDNPAIADTPHWRKKLRDAPNGNGSYWQAENKYQVLLRLNQNFDPNDPDIKPDKERYRLRLDVSRVIWPAPRYKTAPVLP